nr:methyltransferase domain-containing protein [Pseudomonas fulva]
MWVGGATNALDGLVWHDAALGAKATGGAKPTVELFGGKNAQTPGAINVDIRADIQSGIRADATKLPFKDGSLGEVIATNPYMGPGGKMMDFLPEATRVVEPGGKIYINANSANRYGKLPSQAELDSLGLRVVQNNRTLDSRFAG